MFTGSPPFLLHVVAPINLFLRRRLTYRITDFFPEVLIAELGRAPWYLEALRHLTIFCRRRVHRIEVLGEDQRRRLLGMGIRDNRIVLRRDVSPAPVLRTTRALPRPATLAGKKILLYSGNFGVAHEHETFLAGYRRHHREGCAKVAQIVRTLGASALPRRLTTLARNYENTAVRRLGYFLELAGHEPQAKALDKFAQDAKTMKLLDPTSSEAPGEMSGRWKIAVNTPVRRDS